MAPAEAGARRHGRPRRPAINMSTPGDRSHRNADLMLVPLLPRRLKRMQIRIVYLSHTQ